MARRRRGRGALALAVGLATGLALVLLLGRCAAPQLGRPVSPAGPTTPQPSPSASPAGPRSPSPPPTRTVPPPPPGTLRVDPRHLQTYAATRASWDDVLERGRPLPAVNPRCAQRWRESDKDPRLDWTSADYLCLDAISGRGFRPQGVSGSATTGGYRVNGRPAAQRNLVLTSWYSRAAEPGVLFAAHRPGGVVTRLVVMDLDRRRYHTVELVRPDGRGGFRSLNSHGSGLAWAGQYLYSSSRSALWLFNADDILQIRGRFVLPAVGRWTVSGRGGLSSISLDRSATPSQLKGINYTRRGQTYVHSFDLRTDGLLATRTSRARDDMVLANDFGGGRRPVSSVDAVTVPGTSYQGIASLDRHSFANSSGLRLRADDPERVDATVVLRDGKVVERFRMPHGNVESIYLDAQRQTYTTVTERGGQFLFTLPLRELTSGTVR